ncbi:uncharacterized protein LOC133832806 [Humulus lupulus]|uniref:uncharacterized protein LOC133832806 n=1 Tax=Humulus lupulus TaxID=3486 RepID=UPI002B414637|nr:uncharacterized protein LOC133832806 [Humulus lupulus]
MPSDDAFDLYRQPKTTAPASRKRGSMRHPGESNSDPSKKRARTEDPPAPIPSKETTPPAPVDQTPPPAPVDPTPPTTVNPMPPDQSGKTQAEAILNTAYNSANDKLKKLSRHRCSQEAFSNVSSMKVKQIPSRSLNEILSGVFTLSTNWRRSEETYAKHAKEIKAVEGRLIEKLKAVKDRHAQLLEELRAAEEKNAKLGGELKQHKEALAKDTESKERYRESSVLNFKEASKLKNELAISRKETAELEERVKLLEETNASDLEWFKGATFNYFYMFWKNNREANFDYLPERIKQDELAKCIAHRKEEEKVQASPEISLAMGIDGISEDAGTSIDHQPQQDPPAAP